MYCAGNVIIRTTIFVDPAEFEGKPQDVLTQLHESFTKDYRALLTELKPRFVEMAKEVDKALGDVSYLPRFE